MNYLKSLFEQYKPFLEFLGKFFFTYFLLAGLYQIYLANSPDDSIDGITSNVAFLTQKTASLFGMDLVTKYDFMQYQIIYNGNYVARIVEGCNAISVVVLFISFVVAFSKSIFGTFKFIVFGSLSIYTINILRIVFLAFLVSKYPKYEHLFHGVLFPLLIYGYMFLLWFLWVKKYSGFLNSVKDEK